MTFIHFQKHHDDFGLLLYKSTLTLKVTSLSLFCPELLTLISTNIIYLFVFPRLRICIDSSPNLKQ